MKTALITGGLFFLSYIAVNRGLGPNPLETAVTVIVVVGFAAGVSWLMRRGRSAHKGSARRDLEAALTKVMPPSSTPPSGRGRPARKLF